MATVVKTSNALLSHCIILIRDLKSINCVHITSTFNIRHTNNCFAVEYLPNEISDSEKTVSTTTFDPALSRVSTIINE